MIIMIMLCKKMCISLMLSVINVKIISVNSTVCGKYPTDNAQMVLKTPALMMCARFIKTKSCTTVVKIVKLVVPLISEQFTMNNDTPKEFMVQLTVYLV